MQTIREATKADYEAIAAIRNSHNTEPMTSREMWEWDEIDRQVPTNRFIRLVAQDASGQVVGHALSAHYTAMPEGVWLVGVGVERSRFRQGIGQALYAAACRWAVERGATVLESTCRGDDEEAHAWARRRGFESYRLRTESVLDLTAWDGARFGDLVEQVRTTGVTLITVPAVTDETMLRSIHALHAEVVPDVPAFKGTFPPYEAWVGEFQGDPRRRVIALALDGERVIGISILRLPELEGFGARTGFTGVLKSYRGRSIALALKLLTIEAAVARGVPFMRTNNDPDNPGMLAVNERLGYRQVPGPRLLRKHLITKQEEASPCPAL